MLSCSAPQFRCLLSPEANFASRPFAARGVRRKRTFADFAERPQGAVGHGRIAAIQPAQSACRPIFERHSANAAPKEQVTLRSVLAVRLMPNPQQAERGQTGARRFLDQGLSGQGCAWCLPQGTAPERSDEHRKASRYLRSEKALAVGQFKRKKPSAFRLQAP